MRTNNKLYNIRYLDKIKVQLTDNELLNVLFEKNIIADLEIDNENIQEKETLE